MIYGVVGTLDRDTMMKFGLFNVKTGRFQRPASKKGNGKTLVLTYYGYREFKEQGRKVYSNYHTTFSIYKPAQEIMDDLGRILDLAGKYGAYGTITDIIRGFDRIFAHYPLTPIEQTELYELRSLHLEYYGSLILLTEFQKFFNSLGTTTKTIKWVEGILTQLRKLEIDLMWDSQRPISAGNRSREYTETYLVPQKFHSDDLSPCDKDICDRDHLIYVYCDVPFREEELVILSAKDVGTLYETNEIIGDQLCAPMEKTKEEKEKARKRSSKRKAQEEDPALIKNEEDQTLEEMEALFEPREEEGEEDPEIPIVPGPAPRLAIAENDPDVSKCRQPTNTKEEMPDKPRPEIPDLGPSDPAVMDKEIDDLEYELLEGHPKVPVVIKKLLPQFRHAGKLHYLFLQYFNEDGSPILPKELEDLHDEVRELIHDTD